jgi:hypothetical protein
MQVVENGFPRGANKAQEMFAFIGGTAKAVPFQNGQKQLPRGLFRSL